MRFACYCPQWLLLQASQKTAQALVRGMDDVYCRASLACHSLTTACAGRKAQITNASYAYKAYPHLEASWALSEISYNKSPSCHGIKIAHMSLLLVQISTRSKTSESQVHGGLGRSAALQRSVGDRPQRLARSSSNSLPVLLCLHRPHSISFGVKDAFV